MNPILASEIEQKREELMRLCEQCDVQWLSLFGSATSQNWNPRTSDLDFVVCFRRQAEPGIADRYLSLADGLERLFQRPVDLLVDESIENPYLRQAVDASRTQLYAA